MTASSSSSAASSLAWNAASSITDPASSVATSMPTPSGCRVAAAATTASPETATSAYHDAPDAVSGYGDADAPVPCAAHAAGVHELDVVGGDAGGVGDEAAEHRVGRGLATCAAEHEHARARLLELDELAVARYVHAHHPPASRRDAPGLGRAIARGIFRRRHADGL